MASSRSNTRLLREPRGKPVDPHELYRRLKIQESRRKEHASRRARERHSAGKYHHTPQVAALDFQRTATQGVHGKKKIHKLSRSAINRYNNCNEVRPRVSAAIPMVRLSGALAATKLESNSAGAHNQFQRTGELGDAAGADKTNFDEGPQKDFNITFDRISSSRPHKKRTPLDRPYSIGDLDRDIHRLSLNTSTSVQRQPFDRPNWTQEDECHCQEPDSQTSKERMPLTLRRIESVQSTGHRKNQNSQRTEVVAPVVDDRAQETPRKMSFHWSLFCLGRR